MALAIFDLDNTLIGGDSDHLWGEYIIAQGLVDEKAYRRQNDEFYLAYQRAELDIDAYLKFALSPLPERSEAQWQRIHQGFLREAITPIMLPKALQLLDKHRQQGDYLLIITATNGFITRPIAEALAVDHILATDPELIDGQYTGGYLGTPCFAEGKVENLHHWLQDHPFDLRDSYFYSDSINDLPLLLEVGHPVVVNPDPALEQTACDKQWPILDLREPA
ncbi:HAD-IB family hydrolase [Gilvimarinus agarilyticus]|uniref:histidinol-phosphatase n=1 Tax=Gilvimarinus sp. 2_MG-2023 TaxID=3062666 RepID=UPI001C0A22DA|nr:HAD family hydrolase [Gilvimarinus sp. 2_MG-2023]MBU2886584.1 HAD-IB family hydrolase [Gilvimarinus agarilyticus]MDO6571252.1 HAD family hydrolase [Gilvimarinus sp. 2_MG-2023]